MKNFELTEEQVQALEIVSNLLDDLGLSGEKMDLLESIDEEVKLRNKEDEEEFDDDFYFGTSANEFMSELFGI